MSTGLLSVARPSLHFPSRTLLPAIEKKSETCAALRKLSKSAVLNGVSNVPPFPPTAARLLVLPANESEDLGEVADLAGSAPTFSARVPQWVNSIEFGLAHRVGDVRSALNFPGLDHTRQATVTLATRAYSKGALGTGDMRRCWEHTIATAILADELARACGAFTDVVYTAGIIHLIGGGLDFQLDFQRQRGSREKERVAVPVPAVRFPVPCWISRHGALEEPDPSLCTGGRPVS